MHCPFCAETIQDAAVLCRYCGSTLEATGEWCPPTAAAPAAAPVRRRGQLTIQAAGVLFALTGLLSLGSIQTEVPLFGALRGGIVALGYNTLFSAVFIAMGVGLLAGKTWGYHIVMAGTVLYSLDRLLFMASPASREAYLSTSTIIDKANALMDVNTVDEMLLMSNLVSLVCWWGFALYLFLRRDYFNTTE